MSNYKPFVNLGPGDIIKEELECCRWEQRDLAEIMGRTPKNISELVKNKTPITYDTALQLSKVFKQSVTFWLNLDAQYRERLEDGAETKETEARALIYRYMPISELRKLGILSKCRETLKKEVCAFWNFTRLDFGFLDKQAKVCFRKSKAFDHFNPFYALTWIQAVKNSIKGKAPVCQYDAKKLEHLADEITDYSLRKNGVSLFIAQLQACGVIFSHVPHLPHTHTDGASFMHKSNPVLAYTGRLDRIDNFWFTIAHEIGHILKHLHGESDLFVDSFNDIDMTDRREKEADAFAGKILKSAIILSAFADTIRPSSSRVGIESRRLNISTAIIAGCLQHHKKASWNSFHELKSQIKPALKALTPSFDL